MKKLLLSIALVVALVSGCTVFSTPEPLAQRTSEIEVRQVDAAVQGVTRYGSTSPTLRVLSLNMAHGRKDSFSQFFVSEAQIRRNLADIVELLKREDADIVALQEADSPSSWSGNFDHVELLAREAGYRWYTHAWHVDNSFASYGPAVLSRFPSGTPPLRRKWISIWL